MKDYELISQRIFIILFVLIIVVLTLWKLKKSEVVKTGTNSAMGIGENYNR